MPSSDQNVAVWMTCVEVIDRNPVELRSKVLLRLRHQPSDQRLQILVFSAIFRRDDKAD